MRNRYQAYIVSVFFAFVIMLSLCLPLSSQIGVIFTILAIIAIAVVAFIIYLYIYYRKVRKSCSSLLLNKHRADFINEHNYFAYLVMNGFELRSYNVLVRYDIISDTITCYNLKNTLQSFSINNVKSIPMPKNDSVSVLLEDCEYLYDAFLYLFSSVSDYDDMLLISKRFVFEASNSPAGNNIKKKTIKKKASCTININSASTEEIAKLPGISVIQAKKIVKYREESGGFKTKVELYSLLKLKEHFIKEIEDIITIGEMEGQEKYIENDNNDRTVDF